MSAPRALDHPPGVRSAETPKDLSLWHSKRQVLHELYILQGKRLSDVRTIMEREHGFPKTLKDSDYEYILREEFKYRKKLGADEWRLSIGPQIAKRKAEGKRSEVLLNGSKLHNVDRKIQRSFQSKRSRQRVKGHTVALPPGVVIRTPSPRPATVVASLVFGGDLSANEVRKHERYQSVLDSQGDSPAESDCLSLLMGVVPLQNAGPGAIAVLSVQLLREDCPISKLLTILDEYQRKFNHTPLRLFGPNATLSVLGKICFDFSNDLQEETISPYEMKSILDWIGFSVDIASLKNFFSQKSFTILALWKSLSRTVLMWKHSAAFDVLISAHLSIRDQAPWSIGRPFHDLSSCLNVVPNRVETLINVYSCDQGELDHALRTALLKRSPIDVVRQLISAGASLKNENAPISVEALVRYMLSRKGAIDLAPLEMFLKAGAVVDAPQPSAEDPWNVGWHGPLRPRNATDQLLLSDDYSQQNYALWSFVSSYSDRQQTTVTVPGIFQAAQGGQEQLRLYLKARLKPYDEENREKVLEIALSEASDAGHTSVVQNLLQFGVDPNVPTLSRSLLGSENQNIWHPVIRALNVGRVDTLRTLVTESMNDISFSEDDVGLQLDICSLRNMDNPHRDEILQTLSSLDLTTASRSGILLRALTPHRCRLRGHDGPDYGLVDQLLERGLASLDREEHLEAEPSHILVRAIKIGCDVRALEYLIQRDVKVLSTLLVENIGELLEAIMKCCGERHEILEFLAQNVEGFRSYVRDHGSPLLSLLFRHMNCSGSMTNRSGVNPWEHRCEVMITLKWLLNFGAVLEGPVHAAWVAHADDSLIMAIMHSVTNVSAEDHCDALKLLIQSGRLNLAVALIERGVTINYPARIDGCTTSPFQEACGKGTPLWFVKVLIERGAEVNALPESPYGRTALQGACARGAHLSYIRLLIAKGADVNAQPALAHGFTALQFAASKGLMNVSGFLLDHGADVNALSGVTFWTLCDMSVRAIDLAARHSRLDMVHFLIGAGARSCQPGLTGFDGAIDIATGEGNVAIARLLQEHADFCSEDPMKAERIWLQKNPHACMYEGRIQIASWVDYVKTVGEDSEPDVDDYLDQVGSCY